jgi:hypothetical protein
MRRGSTAFRFRHYRPDEDGVKSLIWASEFGEIPLGEVPMGEGDDLAIQRKQLWTPNALADEGEGDMLDVYFDAQAVRTSLFLRLYDDTPIETDTLATLVNEVAESGYGAITVTRGTDWTAPALDAGDMQTSMSQKTFNATGTWDPAVSMVVATVGTGTAGLHIAWVVLSTPRNLTNGDSMNVDLDVKLA